MNKKDELESFSMICRNFTQERASGMRAIWVRNKKFVA